MNEWLPWLWAEARGPQLLFAAAMVLALAALAGELVARASGLPRVVGYTSVGFLAAAFGHGLPLPWPDGVGLIADVALGLLLFEIGSRVDWRWLARNPALLLTSLAESALVSAGVAAALLAIGVDATVATACAVIAMPGSAAVSSRVALELGAAGQVTRRMTVLTALNTLYGVMAAMLLLGWWAARAPSMGDALAQLARSFFGSLLIAGMLAASVALARRLDLRHESTVLLLLGLVVAALAAARHFGLYVLLAPLLAGLLLRHATERAWVWPRQFGTAGGTLVLLLFVIVGASWSPQALAAGGAGALVLIVVRSCAKAAAILSFAPWAHASFRQGLALSIASTPMSATTLVMLGTLVQAAPTAGNGAIPIIMSAVAIMELVGTIAVQWALRYAGELDVKDPAPMPPGERP